MILAEGRRQAGYTGEQPGAGSREREKKDSGKGREEHSLDPSFPLMLFFPHQELQFFPLTFRIKFSEAVGREAEPSFTYWGIK